MTPDRVRAVRRSARSAAAVGALALAATVLAACSGDEAAPAPTAAPTTAAPTDTGTAREAATLVRANPFTGEPEPDGLPDHKAYLVKIENTDSGAPQFGLSKADLVIEELVEGGLTRLAAFYYSDLPSKVGHVRSTRTTDVALVQPSGGQLVASGGAGVTISKIRAAGVDFASEDTGNLVLGRDPSKVAPYDRVLDLASHARSQSGPGDAPGQPYLPFGAQAPAGKRMASTFGVRFSPTSTTRWKWTGQDYSRLNGHAEAGDAVRPDTVVVLFTQQGDAGYRDPAGNPVPETVLTGGGKAQVMHGGKTFTAQWKKKDAKAPFRFHAGGKPIEIPPGKVFLELVPASAGGVSAG